jgi:hexokinase
MLLQYHLKPTAICNIVSKLLYENNLNESILRTLGARGMSMNREFVKNAILRRASRFVGTSIADSFTVKRRCKRLICRQVEFVHTVIQNIYSNSNSW